VAGDLHELDGGELGELTRLLVPELPQEVLGEQHARHLVGFYWAWSEIRPLVLGRGSW
jgi:hypothetical protein